MGGGQSIFDNVTKDDLIVAFFPCIYFENIQMLYFSLEHLNNKNKPIFERIQYAIERLHKRTYFHELLYKLLAVASKINAPLVIENPYSELCYLTGIQNFPKPSIIDKNRMLRGDYFIKPTAYWFFNCSPTYGQSYQNDKPKKTILNCKSGLHAGLCSEERSMISPDYARNFICDFIIGKKQDIGQLSLF